MDSDGMLWNFDAFKRLENGVHSVGSDHKSFMSEEGYGWFCGWMNRMNVNWLLGKGRIGLGLYSFSSISFFYRKNFHLLKKNSKLLRELKNLDSRQWYVKVYQTTSFLSIIVCAWVTELQENTPTKTPKGHSVTRIWWHLHMPCLWCFSTWGISLHVCYAKKRSLLPSNLCLWLRTFSCGSQWTFILI